VKRLTGGKSALKFLPGREDDPKQRCPDISKARVALGYEPIIPLEEGLKLFINWALPRYKGVHQK
jgi:UDP-glucuronate decarboxylase